MKIQQLQYLDKSWIIHMHAEDFDRMQCQLVLVFGDPLLITDTAVFNYLERSYPEAHIILSSTSGEIIQTGVFDKSVAVTAIQFGNTIIHCAETSIYRHKTSYDAGHYLMQQLKQNDLSAAFIISDRTHIDGTELVAGFNEINTHGIPITGGLAGDGCGCTKTLVGLNQLPAEGVIAAIGFYGPQIQVGHGLFSINKQRMEFTGASPAPNPDLAILVSCIGNSPERRTKTIEEVHAVNTWFDAATCTTGFYSYGEISPFHAGSHSVAHDETMTITTFTEF
jgi:hypothetical protein